MTRWIITGLLLLASLKGYAQVNRLPATSDNSGLFALLEKEQRKDLDSLYLSETGFGRDFINGREYIPYYYHSKNIPVLYPDKERTASLIYKGRVFNNLVLQYDTWLDQLIYKDSYMIYNNRSCQAALNSDNVSRFDLYFYDDTMIFKYFSDDRVPGFNLGDGFYEVVYDNMCKYLIRHKASLDKIKEVDGYFYEPDGYVMVGNEFVRITSRKQFVKLFGSMSPEVKNFITKQRIWFRKADKHQIAAILRFYESIKVENR